VGLLVTSVAYFLLSRSLDLAAERAAQARSDEKLGREKAALMGGH
jgi:hypothetical protein